MVTNTQTIQVQEANVQPEMTEQQLANLIRKQEKESGQVKVWFFLKMYIMVMGAGMGLFLYFNAQRILKGALAQNIPKEYVYFLYFFMGIGVVGAQLIGMHAIVYGQVSHLNAEAKAKRELSYARQKAKPTEDQKKKE